MRAIFPAHLTLLNFLILIILGERVQIVRLLLVESSGLLLSPVSQVDIYSSQHPVLNHNQSVFLPWSERPSFTTIATSEYITCREWSTWMRMISPTTYFSHRRVYIYGLSCTKAYTYEDGWYLNAQIIMES
jgi:hypothetical protein